MARLSSAVLLFAGQVEVIVRSLHLQDSPEQPRCECLNWKDVYAQHGVQCGLGLERYSQTWDPISGSLVVNTSDSLLKALNESERLLSICEKLYHRMNHSYAMNEHANYIDVKGGAKRVWCYVPSRAPCNPKDSEPVPGTDIVLKLFREDEVPSFRRLSMDTILNIAQADTLDLAWLLPTGGYANLCSNKFAVDNVTFATLEPFQKLGKPIMLESKVRKAAKIFVYGQRMVTFLPGWPRGSVPLETKFAPTPPPDCPDEECLEFDDYNEFCVRCEDDEKYEDPSFGNFSQFMFNPK